MYISKLNIHDVAGAAKLLRNEYSIHQYVWELFGDTEDRKRDFLYRVHSEGRLPEVYVVSQRKPVQEHKLWTVQTKEYRPVLKEGQLLNFVLRANPVVTRHDDTGKHQRHDIVMDTKKQLNNQAEKLSEANICHTAGLKWLDRRQEGLGFKTYRETLRFDSYTRRSFNKVRSGRKVVISTLDISGTLSVCDPERMRAALFDGIGPAKGFGCGLLLVKGAS